MYRKPKPRYRWYQDLQLWISQYRPDSSWPWAVDGADYHYDRGNRQ